MRGGSGRSGGCASYTPSYTLSWGMSDGEVQWLFDECAGVQFKLVDLILRGDPDNTQAMIEGALSGESGLAQRGFLRFTGKPDVDQRIGAIVERCRSAGVTASHLHLVLIAAAATLAAHANAPHESLAAGTFAANFC